jgi:hypothetical protein
MMPIGGTGAGVALYVQSARGQGLASSLCTVRDVLLLNYKTTSAPAPISFVLLLSPEN